MRYLGALTLSLVVLIIPIIKHNLEVKAKTQDHINTQESAKINDDLCSAARHGNNEEVRSLITTGADVNFINKQRYFSTALILAIVYGHNDTVKILISAGAEINIKSNSGLT